MVDECSSLPAPTASVGLYQPVVLHAGIAYVSGHLPRLNNEVQYVGTIGAGIDLPGARAAAELCVLQCLSALELALGSLDRVERVLKLTGYVACVASYTQQSLVIDAASALLKARLGDRGEHARSAVGVAALPRGGCVEIELIAAIREQI